MRTLIRMPAVPLLRVLRSSLEESLHSGDIAVTDESGELVAFAGEPHRVVFARSSMKPVQAAVSLSFAPLGFSEAEVAIMCASHNAEPVHVETVRTVLARAGIEEQALRCPSVRPWDQETAAFAPERRSINSDCSGKHAGMIAACRSQGWPEDSYLAPEHPVQREVFSAVVAASGVPNPPVGTDGCGVPVHALPLHAMSTIYARLSRPARLGRWEPEAARALAAMRAEPYLVAGRDRVDTAVMRSVEGVIVKGGAEGLVCAALLDRGFGVAIKVRDGSHRAAGPALIRVLDLLDALPEGAASSLLPYSRPPVLGGGEPVGELVADFTLEGAGQES